MATEHLIINYRTTILLFIGFITRLTLGIYITLRLVSLDKYGITPEVAMIIVSFSMVIGIIINIPSGFFSDKYGHKLCTIIGFLFRVLGISLLLGFNSIFSVILSFSLYAIGLSLDDGAFKAWLIQDNIDNSDFIRRINITIAHMSTISLLLGAFIGSILLDMNSQFPWFFIFIFDLFAFMLSLFVKGNIKCETQNTILNTYKNIKNTFLYLFKDISLRSIIIIDIFMFFYLGFLLAGIYPYFNEAFSNKVFARIGFVQLSFSLGFLIGNFLVQHFRNNNSIILRIYNIYPFFNILICILPLLNLSPVLILLVIFLRCILTPFYRITMNSVFDIALRKHEEIRVSAYSVREIIASISVALAMFLAGNFGGYPYVGIWVAAIAFSVLYPIVLYFLQRGNFCLKTIYYS